MPEPQVKPEQPIWLDTGREEAKETGDSSCCRILVIGMGESGKKTVRKLAKAGMPNSNVGCAVVNADFQMHEIESLLSEVDIVFFAAGLSGRAVTSVAPILAESAHRKGAVVVGFVTALTKAGIGKRVSASLNAMRQACDTVVVIDKNKLKELIPQVPSKDARKVADQLLADMIQGVAETMTEPSLVKVNLADFRNVVQRGGVATVGVGRSDATNRAEEAVRNALKSPLLNVDYTSATGALVHVVGDSQMTLDEANHVGEIVTEMMGHDVQVIWGARTKPSDDGFLKVTLMMTGVNSPKTSGESGIMMAKLYDIESSFAESEKPLHVDLGLDQLENFAE